jgi:hypothetical protein
MTRLGASHRPNVLFNLVGVVLIVAGLGLAIYGLVAAVGVMQSFDPLHGDDGPPLGMVDGMTTAFWGVIVFTIGRYFWRGARRRGARDRFGRVLIIAGYLLVGVALDAGMHAASGLWTTSGTGREVVVRTLVTFLVWGIPGSVLAAIGFKLANEKALAKAEMTASASYKVEQG